MPAYLNLINGRIPMLFFRTVLLFVVMVSINGCFTTPSYMYNTPQEIYNQVSFKATYLMSLNRVEVSGKYPIIYDKEKGPKNINLDHFQDETIEIMWSENNYGFEFLLMNKSSNTIRLNWDGAVFVDINGTNMKVMHEGVKYIDRYSIQPDTSILSNGNIKDCAYPSDYIEWRRGYMVSGWNHLPMLYDSQSGGNAEMLKVRVQNYIGKTMAIMIPIIKNDERMEYKFQFIIDDVVIEQI